MKTLIQGGWVVGHNGRGHELLPEGVVVYEDDRIVHVGYGFDGRWIAPSTHAADSSARASSTATFTRAPTPVTSC